jgi:hypothetical protein
MTTSSRKMLGVALVGAAVIAAIILRLCGVRLISHQYHNAGMYGYGYFRMSWLFVVLLAGLLAGLYLLFKRSKN